MKTLVWLLAVTVVGYLAYHAWFTPSEEEEASDQAPPVLEVSHPAEAAVPAAEPGRARLRHVDLGNPDGADEAAAATRPEAEQAVSRLEDALLEAEKAKDTKTAAALEERILKEHPGTEAADWIQFRRGRRHWQAYRRLGRTPEGIREARDAWRLLTPGLFLEQTEAAERKRLRETLRGLADELVFSPRHIGGMDFMYTPKSGDTLDRLCRKVFPARGARMSPGFLVTINGLRGPAGLRAGEPIKVPLGELSLVVIKRQFRLYVLLNGCYLRDFPIGVGKRGSTPEAVFRIGALTKNPPWYQPGTGKKIPYGDPRNILGTRWLGFAATPEHRGFGIHGTSDPSSIGGEASSGCVRMLRPDVELVFSWVRLGTVMVIRR